MRINIPLPCLTNTKFCITWFSSGLAWGAAGTAGFAVVELSDTETGLITNAFPIV